jgi:hypothetical protein
MSVVYPLDYMTDQELLLPASTKYHKKTSDYIVLAQEEIKLQNLTMISTECVFFYTMIELKKIIN